MAQLKSYVTKWSALAKEITEGNKKVPSKYLVPHGEKMLSEAQGVAGALSVCVSFWDKVDKVLESGLGRMLIPVISHAENTKKEIAEYLKAAKLAGGSLTLATELQKELDDLVKDAKAFKDAVAKFEKATD